MRAAGAKTNKNMYTAKLFEI